MGKSLRLQIFWDNQTGHYYRKEQAGDNISSAPVDSEGAIWQEWLVQTSSFSFRGKHGEHFTARKERRERGGAYWTAYRKVKGKLKRKYLGLPQELTLERLEEVAAALVENEPVTTDPSASNLDYATFSTTGSLAPLSARLQEPLLATKFLIPSPPRSLIRRPRLETLLDEGADYPLTLVSAPAGFGKTSLVRNWIDCLTAGNTVVGWLSLDPADNSVIRFWTYFLTALNRGEPGICGQALTLLQTPQAPAMEYVLATLINALVQTDRRFVLVLDDYQEISEPAIHSALDFLIEHQPPQLRLVLLTRNVPPLKLFRLRARGKLQEIRADDLRCNIEEALQFLTEVTGLEHLTPVIDQVMTRTEGWLVGLQLLGLSLRGRTDPTDLLDAFNGNQRYILDYLTEEVLRQQSVSRQEFLLCSSILDPLCGPLCDAVLEQTNSQDILEDLEQANVFVSSLDSQRRWYRYHALFAESLRYQLERTHADLVPALHRRASRWYASQGQTGEAIQHTLVAKDWEFAADLIEAAAWTLLCSDGKMLWNWLQQFPADVVRKRPRLCQLNVSLINRVGPLKQAEPWLEALEKAVVGTSGIRQGSLRLSAREQEQLLGQIYASRALITAYYGDTEQAKALSEQALRQLSDNDHFELALVAAAKATMAEAAGEAEPAGQYLLEASRLHQATGNLADAVLNTAAAAVSLHLQGRLHGAWQTCQKAIELVAPSGGPPSALAGFAYARQANLLREWNQLGAALELVQESIRVGEEIGYPLALLPGYEVMVPVHLSRGDLDGAEEALQHLGQLPCIVDNPCLRAWWYTSSQIRLWLVQGDVEQASRWAEHLQQETRSDSLFTREREDVACARVFLAQQQIDAALNLLHPLIAGATRNKRYDHVIEMRLLEALAHQMGDDEQAALSALAHAVQLGESEGYIRSFVDEGPAIAALLAMLREQQRKQGPTPYLDELLTAFPRGPVAQRPVLRETLPDPLSDREIEVVRELACGASNQEIADRLVLSVETVKRHLYNIFLKLGVSNRTQAVVRAQYLGLLADEH